MLAATSSNPPYQPGVDGGATAFAQPLAPHDFSPRPGSTAVGEGSGNAGHPAYGGEFGYGAAASGMPVVPPSNVVAAAAPKAGGAGRRKGATPFTLIPLFAAGIAGAVVGGLYLAEQHAKHDDQSDDPVATAPSVTAKVDPPPIESSGTQSGNGIVMLRCSPVGMCSCWIAATRSASSTPARASFASAGHSRRWTNVIL
jgi:serine/threonine-protein kinase